MMVLLKLSFIMIAVVTGIYIYYYFAVIKTKKKNEYVENLKEIMQRVISKADAFPKVAILIPTYNEEAIIYEKIRNVSEFDYPHYKFEVFVLDDCSTDQTVKIAHEALQTFGLKGRIVKNETRKGVNALYNEAISQVDSDLILMTDADVIAPRDSLKKGVKILQELEAVGGIGFRIVQVGKEPSASMRTAEVYSGLLMSMLIAESSIHSTFPGSTSFMLIRKSAFSPISTSYGSSDGNISLSIIRRGFRFILAPNIEYYEPSPRMLREQMRQKIRRAARLIQSVLLNCGLLFNRRYKEFGMIIFPLRFMMMTICPIFLMLSIVLIFIFTYFVSILWFAILFACAIALLLLGAKSDIKIFNWIVSFLLHQIYLSVGLLISYRKMNIWKGIERKSNK